MQQVIFQQATPIKFHSDVTRVLPGHDSDTENPASNDEIYLQEESVLKMTLSVLANVVGGMLLLSAMFFLPYVMGRLLS